MWHQYYVNVVTLALICVVIFNEVNVSTSDKNTTKLPLPSNCTNSSKPVEYNVKNFNGTITVEVPGYKSVVPVKIRKGVGKVIVSAGNEKRIQFNLNKENNVTGVLTLKKYNGSVILRGGDQKVEVVVGSKAETGAPHVGERHL